LKQVCQGKLFPAFGMSLTATGGSSSLECFNPNFIETTVSFFMAAGFDFRWRADKLVTMPKDPLL
jgi:hypothetical protein